MSPVNVLSGSSKGSAIHFLIVGGRFFRLFGGQTGGPLVNGDFTGAEGTLEISFLFFGMAGAWISRGFTSKNDLSVIFYRIPVFTVMSP